MFGRNVNVLTAGVYDGVDGSLMTFQCLLFVETFKLLMRGTGLFMGVLNRRHRKRNNNGVRAFEIGVGVVVRQGVFKYQMVSRPQGVKVPKEPSQFSAGSGICLVGNRRSSWRRGGERIESDASRWCEQQRPV